MTQPPFVVITNQQVYDKIVAVDERLRGVELQLARLQTAAKISKRHRGLMYTSLSTAAGAMAAAVIPMVVK